MLRKSLNVNRVCAVKIIPASAAFTQRCHSGSNPSEVYLPPADGIMAKTAGHAESFFLSRLCGSQRPGRHLSRTQWPAFGRRAPGLQFLRLNPVSHRPWLGLQARRSIGHHLLQAGLQPFQIQAVSFAVAMAARLAGSWLDGKMGRGGTLTEGVTLRQMLGARTTSVYGHGDD